MARTPQEVFEHHGEALMAGDLDGIVSDYAEDAVFITPEGVLRGKEGVRRGFVKLLDDLPSAEWALPTMLCEDQGRRWNRYVRFPRWPDPGSDGPLHARLKRLTARPAPGSTRVIETPRGDRSRAR